MAKTPEKLRLSPDFAMLVAPLDEQSKKKLEERLIAKGCFRPIRIWNETVLVDQDAYILCQAHNIPITVSKVPVKSLEEAIAWICKNQLLRSDLDEEMRKYLIGKRFLAEKALGAHEAATARQNAREAGAASAFALPPAIYEATATKTCERLGVEYHCSYGTIRKYGIFANNIDYLHDIDPAFARRIIRGSFHISHEHLVEICNMTTGEILRLAKYFLGGADKRPSYTKYQNLQFKDKPRPVHITPPPGSIKEMPAYDPDAEVNSLALTVPSWHDSVKRVQRQTDFTQISESARWHLIYELESLVYTIQGMVSKLKEDKHG